MHHVYFRNLRSHLCQGLICPQFVLNVVCARSIPHIASHKFLHSSYYKSHYSYASRASLRLFSAAAGKVPIHRSRPILRNLIYVIAKYSPRHCTARHSKSNTKLELARALSLSAAPLGIFIAPLLCFVALCAKGKSLATFYTSLRTFSCGGKREKRKGFNMHGKCCGYTFPCCFTFELA